MEPAIKHNFKALYAFYSIGFLLFLLTAVILIYYSLGYRYDFEKNQIFQTGILRLSPIENNYEIFINNKLVPANKIKKTTEITNLLPKTQEIKISAPDYQDWHKILNISPQIISNEDDILLIPSHPKTSDQFVFNQYDFNFDNNQLAYISNQILNVTNINTLNNQEKFDQLSLTLNSELKWLDSQLLSIINSNPEETLITVINPFNKNTTQLTLPYSIESNQLIGINPQQSNLIIIFHDNQIIEYDLNNKNTENILFENISNPKLNNYQLYLSQNQAIVVHNFFLNTTQNFPVGEITNFHLTPFPEYIILSTKYDNKLYNLNQAAEVFNFSGHIDTIIPNQKLNTLIKTNNELIVIDFTHQPITYQTILRISNQIDQAIWINQNNIAFTSGNELRRIDITGSNNQLISTSETGFTEIINSSKKINAVHLSNDLFLLETIDLSNPNPS